MNRKSQYLLSGYLRCAYLSIQDEEINFEMSLIDVILKFLGNIFIVFDCYPKQYENLMFENGIGFRKDVENKTHYYTFGCLIKWGKGDLHQLSLKSNTKAHG